jgi:hypothetical protein
MPAYFGSRLVLISCFRSALLLKYVVSNHLRRADNNSQDEYATHYRDQLHVMRLLLNMHSLCLQVKQTPGKHTQA